MWWSWSQVWQRPGSGERAIAQGGRRHNQTTGHFGSCSLAERKWRDRSAAVKRRTGSPSSDGRPTDLIPSGRQYSDIRTADYGHAFLLDDWTSDCRYFRGDIKADADKLLCVGPVFFRCRDRAKGNWILDGDAVNV